MSMTIQMPPQPSGGESPCRLKYSVCLRPGTEGYETEAPLLTRSDVRQSLVLGDGGFEVPRVPYLTEWHAARRQRGPQRQGTAGQGVPTVDSLRAVHAGGDDAKTAEVVHRLLLCLDPFLHVQR